MALMKPIKSGREVSVHRPTELFESLFSDWPAVFRRSFVVVPEGMGTMKMDQYTEGGTLVVRIEMAGLDPEKDVEISLDGDVLHIEAERHQGEETNERDYTRRELRFGSFHRDLPVPTGTTEADVKANYKDGILEVRVPTTATVPGAPPAKIPVSTA